MRNRKPPIDLDSLMAAHVVASRSTVVSSKTKPQPKTSVVADPLGEFNNLLKRLNPRKRPLPKIESHRARTLWSWSPNLRWYDVILLNHSGGKDSMAMTDVVVNLADQQNVLDRVHIVHCDLGEVEWPQTKALVAEHARHYQLPLHVVQHRVRGETVDFLERIERRGRWPAGGPARYCTSEFKTGEVKKLLTALVREYRPEAFTPHGGLRGGGVKEVYGRRIRFLNVLGLRAEEGRERSERIPFYLDAATTSTTRLVHRWLPVHGWSEDEVWARIATTGLRHHKAYDLGMSRLSCRLCVMASRNDLNIAAKANPKLARKYLALEQRMGESFKKNLSMREILEGLGMTRRLTRKRR